MAAASADSETHNTETAIVEAILLGLSDGKLPAQVKARLSGFDPKGFDLAQTVKSLEPLDASHRKELFAMVSKVTESDDIHDLDESAFIIALAKATGASADEYAGLTVELAEAPGAAPPPAPTQTKKP